MSTVLQPRPLAERLGRARHAAQPQRVGSVTSVVGLGLEVSGLDCAVGDLVRVGTDGNLEAEVVAVTSSAVRCMPLGRLTGISAGDPVRATGSPATVPTGLGLFGRVLDGLGRPMDGKGPLNSGPVVSIDKAAPLAMQRARIS